MDEKVTAIHKIAFAFGCTCDGIRKELEVYIDDLRQQQMFNAVKREIQLLGKGKSKSYLSSYAKFDKLIKKRK